MKNLSANKFEILRTGRNLSWLFFQGLSTLAISFWILPSLSLNLSPVQVATIGTFLSLYVFYQVAANFGQNITGMSDFAKDDGAFVPNYLIMRMINTALFCLFVMIFFRLESYSLSDFFLFEGFIVSQIFVVVWLVQYKGKQGTISRINILGVLLSICLERAFRDNLLTDPGINLQLAFLILILPILMVAAYNTWFLQPFNLNKIEMKIVIGIYRNNLKVFISQVFSAAYTVSGVLILVAFVEPYELSHYVLLEKMYFSLSAGLALLVTAAQPTIVDVARTSQKKSIWILASISIVLLLSSIFISVVLWELGDVFFGRYLDVGKDIFRETQLWLSVWFVLSVFGPILSLSLVIMDMRDKILGVTTKIFIVTFGSLAFMGSIQVTDWIIAMICGQIFVLLMFLQLIRNFFNNHLAD